MSQIVFLGSGGARIVVFKQIRASGGIWITLDETQMLVDPGPGCLVRCVNSKSNLDPTTLDGIILSHRHLDHSADVNVMIEAMTQGGFEPRGAVFAPEDALEDDPVILRYIRKYIPRIEILKEGGEYELKSIKFNTPIRHRHGGETYGINFIGTKQSISYIADTKYFEGIETYYHGDTFIINVLREKPSEIDHLCIEDAKKIISQAKPNLTILTHFGMQIIKSKPWEVADKITNELGLQVIAANDGMKVEL
ncbi:MAG: MBL fold metallo-hydrolase [Candidatus Stahlbacteria bacterium]|nr:MBL fold metallo-hydrolase [Candidatus Stahlbacteria bacterium]